LDEWPDQALLGPSAVTARKMKTKVKIIIVTFLATTAFWCLAVVAFFWLPPRKSGVDVVEDARQRGFIAVLRAWNTESRPVTFRVEELYTNKPGATDSQVVLLERQVPPSSEFRVGIRKTASK